MRVVPALVERLRTTYRARAWAAITKEAFGHPLAIDPQRMSAASRRGMVPQSIGKMLVARLTGRLPTTPDTTARSPLCTGRSGGTPAHG